MRIDTAKQSMPWLLRSFRASEQKFWKDGSVNVRVLDYKKRMQKDWEGERTAEKKAKEETHYVTPRWKIKVNRYPPRSCYSIPGKKKKNNSASRCACF